MMSNYETYNGSGIVGLRVTQVTRIMSSLSDEQKERLESGGVVDIGSAYIFIAGTHTVANGCLIKALSMKAKAEAANVAETANIEKEDNTKKINIKNK